MGRTAPRRLLAGVVSRAQEAGQIACDLDPDAIARTLIAIFQGFVLQASWGEPVDFDACLKTVERMLDGLSTAQAGASP